MSSSLLGVSDYYYKSFVSPFKNYEVNPTANLIYGATASKIYSQTVARKLHSSMSSYLSSLNRNVYELKNSAKSIAEVGSKSVYAQKAVNSTDTAAVTGLANSNATVKSYTLNISKLASTQINEGTKLKSNDPIALSTGVNTFSLNVGDTVKNISFVINENDTNKTGLENMAKAINYSKIGVTAQVISDEKAGTSFLKITAEKTGTDHGFSLTDISGNAVAISGASNTTNNAENAQYLVNGAQYSSPENSISLDDGKVQITLRKAENKDIKLEVKADEQSMKSGIEEFVKSYNSVISFVNTNSADFYGAEKLLNELNNIMKSRKSSLERMGISINNDSTLSIDTKKLDNAVHENLSGIKNTFSGYNGIAEKVSMKSTEVLSSPLEYSKPSQINSFYNYSVSNSRLTFAQNLFKGLVVDTML